MGFVMIPALSSLVAPKVVVRTSDAQSDDKFGIPTIIILPWIRRQLMSQEHQNQLQMCRFSQHVSQLCSAA